jgi:2-phosphoglycerate kinase
VSERRRPVSVTNRDHGLPFSKGLWASTLTVTGLSPAAAYSIANKIEDRLRDQERDRVSEEELHELTLDVLRKHSDERYAEAFIKWQSVSELNLPLIILIGGATGVGKSTIATQLATRLGITRVVGTDAVREVLRSAFTEQMFPTLYASSYQADSAVRQPIPHSGDRLIIGFREQAAAVAVGAQALIERAIEEGTDLIIEGAHLVPGFLQAVESDRALIVSLLITVEDEQLHKSHFYRRGREANARSQEKYLSAFKKIRRIQRYMISSALMRGVPVIPHDDLDATLAQVLDHVITEALEAGAGNAPEVSDGGLLGKAAQVIEKQKGEGSKKREAVP